MDLQKEKHEYLSMLVDHGAITQEQSDSLSLLNSNIGLHSNSLTSSLVDCINWGWQSWLKAKAQAVPEGFVLVSKEPNREFKDRLRSYLDNLWMGEWGCDWDGFICVNGIDPNEIWQFMIEAQEQAHD